MASSSEIIKKIAVVRMPDVHVGRNGVGDHGPDASVNMLIMGP